MTHTCNCGCTGDPVRCTPLPVDELGLRHRKVAKMIHDTLRIGEQTAFLNLARYFYAKLTPGERRGLALASLVSCKEEGGDEVVDLVFPSQRGAGTPGVPFDEFDIELDAKLWTTSATQVELRAYFIAIYQGLPTTSRRALLNRLHQEAA